MHVEDFITILSLTRLGNYNKWDSQLIYSFADQVSRGNGLTEKQANLALKIVKRHNTILAQHLGKDISHFLQNPTYKFPFRKINDLKRISIKSDATYGKVIKVEFPYDEALIKKIREEKSKLAHRVWDKDEKAWIFSLTEQNIKFLINFCDQNNFVWDEEFENYIFQTNAIIENMENHVPMVVLEENLPKFRNTHSSIPQLNTKNVIEAVLEARKYGITTYDDQICEIVKSIANSKITLDFIKQGFEDPFQVNTSIYCISDLADIVKYLNPCLFVIPGGSELEKIKLCYDFLSSMGIENKNMSVMFRLPSESSSGFNEFIKNNKLNSPINDQTSIVFISSKLPKPIIKSKIKFHSIVSLGAASVHYTVQNFLKNHENLIFFTEEKSGKEFNFGDL